MTAAAPYLRRICTPLQPLALTPADLPPSLEAAYRGLAVLTAADPGRWGGWKLGGSNAASRAAFGVTTPYYGAIDRAEMLAPGPEPAAAVPGFALFEVKGEAEIALRIAPDGAGFDAWCLALEMPSSPVQDLVGLGVVALVADRCAAGALVLGPVQTGPLPPPSARVTQEIGGRLAGEGLVGGLSASPTELLGEFLDLARSHGAPVAPGHWVATGGITPCLPYAEGDRVRVALDGAVSLDLVIATVLGA